MEGLGIKKERLQKAFVDLDEHRKAFAKCTIQWKELEDHFNSLESNIKKRLEDLEAKEKTFEVKQKEMQDLLDKREQSIAEKEQASLARVQEQKDVAFALIVEERKKFKTEGVADIDPSEVFMEDPKKGKENGNLNVKVSVHEEDVKKDTKCPTSNPDSEAKPLIQVRPQLKTLCETMDSKGLLKYIVEHRKDSAGLRAEIPCALNFALDPSKLVLESLEGFYSPEKLKSGDKKESTLHAQRRACVLLLESLMTVLADPAKDVEHPVVTPPAMKEQAKSIANEWKSKVNVDGDVASGNSMEAQAFLQLLATFGIASDFDKDELCKLVLAVARRRQTPELCRSLGLSSKMPEFVETLVNSGKQIEAVNFAHAFGLTEKFSPVPLLKEFLKDAKKASQASLKHGNNSTAAQNEANTKELSAYRAVIRCIEEHNLESQFSLEPLQKRVALLEKAKADRKRSAAALKLQPKRPRANGANVSVYASQLSSAERAPTLYTSTTAAADRSFYRPVDRVQYSTSASSIASYGLQGQSAYERPSQGLYGSAYGVGNRSPVSLSRSYIYPGESMAPSLLGSGSYSANATYNNHHFSGSLAHPPSAYPSYIH